MPEFLSSRLTQTVIFVSARAHLAHGLLDLAAHRRGAAHVHVRVLLQQQTPQVGGARGHAVLHIGLGRRLGADEKTKEVAKTGER